MFGSERMISMFNVLAIEEGQEIQHKLLTKAIETAQSKIESNNYAIRKTLLEYDQVMNEQREIIYAERLRVLNGESMRDVVYKMITDTVENAVDTCISDDASAKDWDLKELNQVLRPNVPIQLVPSENMSNMKKNELKHMLKEQAVKLYESKEMEFPQAEAVREVERVILLKVIDRKWMNHIDDMEQLKQGIGLQAYGQKDPLVEYKMNAFDMFENMSAAIQEETVRVLTHVKVEQDIKRQKTVKR